MTKNIIDSAIKKVLSNHPRVFYKKRGTRLSSSSFSIDKIYKDINPLNIPLRQIRTGNEFMPRRTRILKERITTKLVKNILKDSKSKNYFKKVTTIPIADWPESFGKKGIRVNIPPQKFMELAQKTSRQPEWNSIPSEIYTERVISKGNVEKIKKGLLSPKEVVPIGWVEFEKGKPKDHEGRHRAVAAEKLGYKTIPVVFTEKDEGFIAEKGPKLFEEWKEVTEEVSPFKHEHNPKVDNDTEDKVEWEKEKNEYYEDMTPEAFLKYTGTKTEELRNLYEYYDKEENKNLPIKNLVEKMEKGIKVQAPFLHGTLEEGKRRMIAARLSGEKSVPVAVNLPYEMRNKEVLDEFLKRAYPGQSSDTTLYEEWRERFDKGYPHWSMSKETFGTFLNVLRDKGIKTDKFILSDNKSKPLILYHGTKAYKLPSILKEGLKPGKQLGSYSVYLTPHKWRAEYYAKKGNTFNKIIKGKQKKGVILEVDVPEKDLEKYKKNFSRGFPYTDIKIYNPIPPKNIVNIDISKDRNILRCFWCGKDLTGIQPHIYDGFKFCSGKCVQDYLGYEK